MWLGRGTWFPFIHGWHGGALTRAVSALFARAYSERSFGSTNAVVQVFVRSACVESLVCRDLSADGCQRKPFLYEAAIPCSALARGPPTRHRRHLNFQKWICEICCIDKEK
jgi:hypothetical protein